MDNFERELRNIAFPNYEKFSEVKSTYSDLVNKTTQAINNLVPYKTTKSVQQMD